MRRRSLGAAVIALALVASPRSARAQLHADASAQAGPIKRWLASKPEGGADATFGAQAQLAGHVALLPLVRAGGYATFDVTGAGDATRFFAGGGLHVKLLAPLPSRTHRVWLFAGLGLLGAWSPAYTSTFTVQRPLDVVPFVSEGRAEGASGRLFEVPVGAGVSRKLWGPYALTAELGLRLGFAHGGSLYEAPGRAFVETSRRSFPSVFEAGGRAPPQGLDRFAVGLTVGVLYDM
jgi:hypothetical protein